MSPSGHEGGHLADPISPAACRKEKTMGIPTRPMIAEIDMENAEAYSALDQRGWSKPVQTVDGIGCTPLRAVFELNEKLVEMGIAPYDTNEIQDVTPEHMRGSDRWRFAATHILDEDTEAVPDSSHQEEKDMVFILWEDQSPAEQVPQGYHKSLEGAQRKTAELTSTELSTLWWKQERSHTWVLRGTKYRGSSLYITCEELLD